MLLKHVWVVLERKYSKCIVCETFEGDPYISNRTRMYFHIYEDGETPPPVQTPGVCYGICTGIDEILFDHLEDAKDALQRYEWFWDDTNHEAVPNTIYTYPFVKKLKC